MTGLKGLVMKKRFSEEQIVGFLREAQIGGKTVEQLGREHGFSPNSYYTWKRKYGAMGEPEVKRLRELEKENSRLKRLLAERDVEIDVMREIVEKKLPA
jgi:putative transposase